MFVSNLIFIHVYTVADTQLAHGPALTSKEDSCDLTTGTSLLVYETHLRCIIGLL